MHASHTMLKIIDDILFEIETIEDLQYGDVDDLFDEMEHLVTETPLDFTKYQHACYNIMLEELYIAKGALSDCVEAIKGFRASLCISD
jgi:hypothetical protein